MHGGRPSPHQGTMIRLQFGSSVCHRLTLALRIVSYRPQSDGQSVLCHNSGTFQHRKYSIPSCCIIQFATIFLTLSSKTLLSRPSFLCPFLPPVRALAIAFRKRSLPSSLRCLSARDSSASRRFFASSSRRSWAKRTSFSKGTGFGLRILSSWGRSSGTTWIGLCFASGCSNIACRAGCSSIDAGGLAGSGGGASE